MKIRFNSLHEKQGGWTLVEILAAAIVIGMGVLLFMRTQSNSNRHSDGNTKRLKAGQLIEKHLESIRISIAQDTLNNFPTNATDIIVLSATPPDNIKLKRTIGNANSPKDNAIVNNVKQVDLVASWGSGAMDTMKVTTYVSKRF